MDKTRLFTGVVLLLLALYALAGLFTAPFHADESMYLSQSRDYVTYFVIGAPGRLRVDPPVTIDSPAYQRLVTGTVSTDAMGFILWNTGYRDLEHWQPAWYFSDDVATNIAAGRLPPDDVLWRGRLASALFLVGSIGIIATLGQKLVSRRAGALAATTFALHPVILLNGRRAMQEGPLMFFTLMTVWAAHRVVERRRWFDWSLLGMMAGLACASKASALMPLLGVGLGLLLVMRKLPVKGLAITVISAAIFFVALTPAIWTNPPARMHLAAELRRDVLRGQVAASPEAHVSALDRLTALISQPFPAEIQYFESPDFASDDALRADIVRYDQSPLRGILLPAWVGMGLAALGLLHLIRLGNPIVLSWAGVTLLLVGVMVPLGWERYYLPWTMVAVVFAGLGLDFLAGRVQAFLPEKFRVWPRTVFPTRPSKL